MGRQMHINRHDAWAHTNCTTTSVFTVIVIAEAITITSVFGLATIETNNGLCLKWFFFLAHNAITGSIFISAVLFSVQRIKNEAFDVKDFVVVLRALDPSSIGPHVELLSPLNSHKNRFLSECRHYLQ